MPYLITKEAYNVMNARLRDLVWSCELNNEENKKFAAYFDAIVTAYRDWETRLPSVVPGRFLSSTIFSE